MLIGRVYLSLKNITNLVVSNCDCKKVGIIMPKILVQM